MASMTDDTVTKAFELLGLDPEKATETEVKRAYRTFAMSAHPDRGGSEERMKEFNLAYERCLEVVHERVDPKCVCFGFTRNPLCKVDHEGKGTTTSDEQCPECHGTKKVEVGGWAKIKMDCPKCT